MFFFSSRRRHTRYIGDWSSDVCSSDLPMPPSWFEVRHWMSNHEGGIGERPGKKDSNTVGNLFYGSKGYLAIDGYGTYKTFLGKDQEPGPSAHEDGNNWANFIEAVRSRKPSDRNAHIEEGLLSTI